MKVYTRKGDDGGTALADGSRVTKSGGRVAAYGEVDELNAVIGIVRAEALGEAVDVQLARTQGCLFEIGAFLADPTGRFVVGDDVRDPHWLEEWIDVMDGELPPLRSFIVPAGARAAALAHQARAVCRRAERSVVALLPTDASVASLVPMLNRLSDAFFVLARWLNQRAGIGDVAWRRTA